MASRPEGAPVDPTGCDPTIRSASEAALRERAPTVIPVAVDLTFSRSRTMSDLLAHLQASLGDEYALEREMTGTQMARLFIARERVFNRAILITVLSRENVHGLDFEQFATEVGQAAALNHPGIVPPLMIGTADGLPYIITPYVPGVSLRDRLVEQPALSLEEIVSILRSLAESLHVLHTAQQCHFDLNPDTVLVTQRTALITDTGTTRALRVSRPDGSAFVGNASHLAPEQLSPTDAPDSRADLYAWGSVAYEMLTGMAPYPRSVADGCVVDAPHEQPAPISLVRRDVPATLTRLIMRTLARDPAARPATADDILQVLQTVDVSERAMAERSLTPAYVATVDGAPTTSKKTATTVPIVVRKREMRRVAAIAAAVVAVIGTTAAFMMHTPEPPEEAPLAPAPVAVIAHSTTVLPLAVVGGAGDDVLLGAGLSAELASQLARNGVLVAATTSAGTLRANGIAPREVARRVGVASILTGTMKRQGDVLHISIALLSANDAQTLWSAQFDRAVGELFAVEDEIVRNVSAKVQGTPGISAAGVVAVGTRVPDAHLLLLQGHAFAHRASGGSVAEAMAHYRAAIARDTGYARAYASLALSCATLSELTSSAEPVLLDECASAARQAVARDSTLADAYTALGWLDAIHGRNREADKQFRRSLALDSTVAVAWGWYGVLATHVGDYATAHARVVRARQLEPESPRARAWDAQVFFGEEKYDRAEQAARPIPRLDSTLSAAVMTRAEALMALGRDTLAIALLEPRVDASTEDVGSEAHALLAYAYAVNGQEGKARDMLLAIRDKSGRLLPPRATLALTLAALGDRDSALALLARAVEKHDPTLFTFNHARRFESLRKDPRGAALFASIERW